jgi:hypothetical protein
LLAFAGARFLLDRTSGSSEGQLEANAAQSAGDLTSDSFSNVAGAVRSSDGEAAPTRARAQKRERNAQPTPVHVDRQDCSVLRGRHDRTRSERQWYIDNCLFLSRKARDAGLIPNRDIQPNPNFEAQLQAAGFSLDETPPRRSAGQAGATPPPELTASVAVMKAVDWIPDNTPVTVSLAPADCTPIWLNGHWVVTCDVTLEGCSYQYCVASLSVCVFPTEPAIVPDLYC